MLPGLPSAMFVVPFKLESVQEKLEGLAGPASPSTSTHTLAGLTRGCVS